MGRNFFQRLTLGVSVAVGVAAAAASAPQSAQACGGFFCSSANPVNQAAEQIIFADNGDGTVTAVIQIMYEGPAERFAWVLPVPGDPDVALSSDQALDALKQATNPQYRLNTVFTGSCGFDAAPGSAAGGAGTGGALPPAADPDGGVTVVASGAIGPYEHVTISVDPETDDPAQAAVDWLETNEFDVGAIGADVLRPYLAEGLNLIAFRLQKGSSSGSIRPVMLTYESALPSIPIRPTAVAANEDMGVLVWTLAGARGIPKNYKGLELNEALIDWFNPNNNYNEVVSRAADEAGGQGFVTEYADSVDALTARGFSIFPDWQMSTWSQFASTQHTDPVQMVQEATANWGGWDGFDDALRASVMLPGSIAFDDFKNCMPCYINADGVTFNVTTYLTNLYEMVIKPMIDTQRLLESHAYITRLYTTMSADEMDTDPVFDFNPDLEDVSNIHVADRIIDTCNVTSGPWTVELPQGDTVRGTMFGVWPIGIDEMPAARKILQFGTEGDPRVIEDRSTDITGMMGGGGPSTGTAGSGGTAGRGSTPGGGGDDKQPSGSAGTGGGASENNDRIVDDGGCSAAGGRPAASGLALLMLALASLVRRRRA